MKPLGKRHTLIARQKLADLHGVEMTSSEIEETLKSAFGRIRTALRVQGWTVPDDDAEFFLLLRHVLGPEGLRQVEGDD